MSSPRRNPSPRRGDGPPRTGGGAPRRGDAPGRGDAPRRGDAPGRASGDAPRRASGDAPRRASGENPRRGGDGGGRDGGRGGAPRTGGGAPRTGSGAPRTGGGASRTGGGGTPRTGGGGAPLTGGGGRGGAPRRGESDTSRGTDARRSEPLGRDGQPAPRRASRTVGRGKAATPERPYQDVWEEEEGDPNWAAKLDEPKEGERLQKVLAAAGVGSRRACEELIEQGRVSVDGDVVRVQGKRVDPLTAVIHVDGQRVIVDDRMVYLAFNKPKGVLSAMTDDKGRPTVGDYVADRDTRVFHVGRLDAESEGLLLLTNDGALSHRLTHPSYGVLKTYLAEVPGPMNNDVRKRLLEGVELEDGPVKVDRFRVVDNLPGKLLVEVVIHEGRKHVVRRLLEEVGHPVSRLVRTAIGPVQLASLKPGKTRHLNHAEIGQLHSEVGL
ncbi:hypothetical protein GCM10020369_40820 [Cryptosporangium minutisporangium]|uniref:Pseudouridine synthase n=3 Tax=Cryptosporangium minutisporangium TaxID=113569 RepID=A0ABP6T138_9ACTN